MNTSHAPKRDEKLKRGNIVMRREEADEVLLRTRSNMKLEEIIKLIESNDPCVQRVDLWWRQTGRKLLKPLISALAITTAVRELDLSGNKLRKEGTKLLAKSLAGNKTLTSLSLHNNEIGKEGAKALAGLLKVNSTILSLLIGGNGIGRDGVEYLLPVLALPSATLASLSISSNDIKSKGAESVAKVIQQNRSLTYLDVSSNDLTNAGAKALFLALKMNEKILFLNVSYNEKGLPIARVGLKAINELLLRNRAQLPPDAYQGKLSPLELASPISLCSAPNLLTGGSGPPSPRTTPVSGNWTPPPVSNSNRANSATRFVPPNSTSSSLKKDLSCTVLQSSSPQTTPQNSVSLPSKEDSDTESPKTNMTFSSSAGSTAASSRRKKQDTPRVPKIKWNEYTQIFGSVKMSAPLNDTKRTASIRMTDKLTGDQITQLAQIANTTNPEDNEKEESE